MRLLYLKSRLVIAWLPLPRNTVYYFSFAKGRYPLALTLDPTLALFAQWAQEDARKTYEDRAQEELLWEQFEANLNETRAALSMRRL